ncbi:tetratricopeptide repeat protein [Mucilaginibacter sp. X4EP1]|uniref:tetratricopeptide repeat-containing sensor histidine kinase n=1 Tax=Mucilaginibacter sp. X4EP1 TaxID=2723092 RepID=UPI00216954D7|nr:tetratricopeptide repeat-containing sensor histidine kinase [Mucilaginibacter sp. X4EP1]MCS3813301.1 signal transduction histidine kinase [Mucilaginibacter sp. X4EP1]
MRKLLLMHRLYLFVQLIIIYGTVTFVCTSSCFAQINQIKHFSADLSKAKQDTNLVNTYYNLSRQYWNKNADSALLMADKSLELAKKIHFEKGIALGYLLKGVALGYKGNWPEALDCHLQCLRISEKLGMEGLTGNEYNNIAGMYTSLEDYTKALYYNRQAYKIVLKQHDPTGFATYALLVNMGEIFKYKGQPDSAIAYNSRALVVAKRAKDANSIATALYNIGENYVTKKNYTQAEVYFYKALDIAKKAGDDEDVAYCHTGLALTSYYTGKYNSSMLYAEKGLEESRKSGIVELIQKAYHVLYLTHQQTGNYQQSLYYRNLEVELTDSLNTAAKQKAIRNIQSTYELDKKQRQIDLLNKDKIINQKELEKIKLKWDILTAGTVSLLLLAFILFRNYKEKQTLSEQLILQNKNISEQKERLEELVLVKDRLFSIIGHDLRGPIHAINQMLDMLKEGDLSEEESDFWIEKTSDHLTMTAHLVENLLYWAKSQMDGIHTNPVNFDVQKVIEQNVMLIKARAAEKKVTVTSMAATGAEIVYGDETMIDIVIRNLVENAVKFSKEGDIVTISAEKKELLTLITVNDNGKGIPEEAQAKIFDKLSSYTTYGTASEKGSGLGLLLCKELVEKNNGTLWFQSKTDIGSSFYFTIP